jgi:dCMP deaminase
MFVGIAGPICAGKRTTAEYLVAQHGFTRLRLRLGANAHDALGTTCPDQDVHGLSNGLKMLSVTADGNGDVWFSSMADMAEFVTKRWQEHFVTVDIRTEADLQVIEKRPFFLLISVDAPVTVRWNRFHIRFSSPCFQAVNDEADVFSSGNQYLRSNNSSRTLIQTFMHPTASCLSFNAPKSGS